MRGQAGPPVVEHGQEIDASAYYPRFGNQKLLAVFFKPKQQARDLSSL